MCVLRRYRKGLRGSRDPSASLAPLRDSDELAWVFWAGKVCCQLRDPPGNDARQVLNPGGIKPRESPRRQKENFINKN